MVVFFMLSKSLHKFNSGCLHRRLVALIQVVVMLMLALPIYCYGELSSPEKTTKVSTSEAADVDKCPCCPDEDRSDSDNCSACSYCSPYGPIFQQPPSTFYAPSVAQLTPCEQPTRLPDVHIPIFVPPQNFA